MHIDTGAEPFDPDKYLGQRLDHTGRTVKRDLIAIRRLADTQSGERSFECVCTLCSRRYAMTDTQISNPRFEPCGCTKR